MIEGSVDIHFAAQLRGCGIFCDRMMNACFLARFKICFLYVFVTGVVFYATHGTPRVVVSVANRARMGISHGRGVLMALLLNNEI